MLLKSKREKKISLNEWNTINWLFIKCKVFLSLGNSKIGYFFRYCIQCLVVIFISLSLFEIIHIFLLQVQRDNIKQIYPSKTNIFKLINVEHAEPVVISSNRDENWKLYGNCDFFNCFNVNLCDRKFDSIKVYIYPVKKYVNTKNEPLFEEFSEEYWQLLTAIANSSYYTNEAKDACLFIPSLDTLSLSKPDELNKVLTSLMYWGRFGENHLLFNMIPGFFPHRPHMFVNTDKAIIAGGGFNTWTFRPMFDIAIPVYSPLSVGYDQTGLADKKRKWFIVSPQSNLIDKELLKNLKHLEYNHEDELLLLKADCHKEMNVSSLVRCNRKRNLNLDYLKILEDSKFCLFMRTNDLNSVLLSDSLMTGCIPIILADEFVLPFEEKIDWTMISIKIREHFLPQLINLVKEIPEKIVKQMRMQAMRIWEQYFSSIKSIVLSTLHLINERVFPENVISKFKWNSYNKIYKTKPLSLINPKLTSHISQGFTAVILSYDRLASLYQIIKRLSQTESCVKIIVVWNNPEQKVPKLQDWPKIDLPLQILTTKENILSNRFYPFLEIKTEAVLSIDDDLIMLTSDELEFAFQVWREFPDRLVGFPSRLHEWCKDIMQWKYISDINNQVSMVLTGAAFYHNYYNYLYTFELPKDIHNYVKLKRNCEDIAMNFLISHVTGKAPIKVTPRKSFICTECPQKTELSRNITEHLAERSRCVNYFAEVYKSMPLKEVEFRADPVLFYDNLPKRLKKFINIHDE